MKGIKATVTIETTYSFNVTEDNGFDGIDFNDLESILDVTQGIKNNPQNYCSAMGLEDEDLRYDQSTKVANVKLDFIKE